MRHDRHQPLPDPLKIPKESSLHQGVYGSNLLYPVEALAPALACPANNPAQLHHTIALLYQKCVIRFGIPSDAPRSMTEAIELPKNPSLRYGPRNLPMDPRWERLARALEITEPNAPISIRALSPEHMSALISDTQELAAMFEKSSCTRLDAKIVDSFADIASDIRANRRYASENIKNLISDISESAYRQLRIGIELGPEWTLVNSEERLVLTSQAARRPRHPSDVCRTDKDEAPAESLLNPYHLRWMWKDARGAWEPAFKGSAKHKSSLFDQSARYFAKVRAHDAAKSWSPDTVIFLEKLEAARDSFQLARHQQPWREPELLRELHARQNSLLDDLIDGGIGMPEARQ